MDNQEALYNKIKQAAEQDTEVDDGLSEDVWLRVTARLDEEKSKRIIPFRRISVAAAVLFVIALGGYLLSDNWSNQSQNNFNNHAGLKKNVLSGDDKNGVPEESSKSELPEQQDRVAQNSNSRNVANERYTPDLERHRIEGVEIYGRRIDKRSYSGSSTTITTSGEIHKYPITHLTKSERKQLRNLRKSQRGWFLPRLLDKIFSSKKENEIKEVTRSDDDGAHEKDNNEDYEPYIENAFTNTRKEPLSTFSVDVDNASYSIIRRFINNGQKVPKDAVRIEEMINYFKYNYEPPTGEHPVALHSEYNIAPWNKQHKILKIGLQGAEIPMDKLPASNLVFLIDVSGSMDEANKLPLLKSSFKMLVSKLKSDDVVSIVVYAGAAGVVLPPTKGNEKEKIIAALDALDAGGSTAGGEGIELAYKLAQDNFKPGGNNRVILATDGDFNVGASSNEDMQQLIEQKRKSNIFLTCLGYGMGDYKDSKLELLADKGNGNYAYIDNAKEANRFLVKAFGGTMFTIAKDVKIQVDFNPDYVASYRLIGYENRKLNAEDFANDEVDAGEIGSGHTVTALYEIIPIGVSSKFLPDDKRNSAKKNKGNDELAVVKFRYKKPTGNKSIELVEKIPLTNAGRSDASTDFKFSTAVAWFGLKLRDSKLVADQEWQHIIDWGKEATSATEDEEKIEFLELLQEMEE